MVLPVLSTVVVAAVRNFARACGGIKILLFKRLRQDAEITYLWEAIRKLKHVTKGTTGIIIEL